MDFPLTTILLNCQFRKNNIELSTETISDIRVSENLPLRTSLNAYQVLLSQKYKLVHEPPSCFQRRQM
jgi:hypothetical protein